MFECQQLAWLIIFLTYQLTLRGKICTITFVKKLISIRYDTVCEMRVVLLPAVPQMAAHYLKPMSALSTQMCVNVFPFHVPKHSTGWPVDS